MSSGFGAMAAEKKGSYSDGKRDYFTLRGLFLKGLALSYLAIAISVLISVKYRSVAALGFLFFLVFIGIVISSRIK